MYLQPMINSAINTDKTQDKSQAMFVRPFQVKDPQQRVIKQYETNQRHIQLLKKAQQWYPVA